MDSRALRGTFLNFFSDKGHLVWKSSSLIPANDPTILFTNAGMNQFKNFFLGVDEPPRRAICSCQKCLRISGKHNDLENIGFTRRHHTFFEMLGNFSFGDYFKKEAISFAWEFVTEQLKIDPALIWVTFYKEDNETKTLWKSVTNLPESKIIPMGSDDNFWSMGDTGPCGPCTEIYVLLDPTQINSADPYHNPDQFLEIWNLVFIEFNRTSQGELKPLQIKCIDTGMGLERVLSIVQRVPSNFDTDLFRPIIKEIEKASGHDYKSTGFTSPKELRNLNEIEKRDLSLRVLSDHSRAITFLIAEGLLPGNEERQYVLRKLIRRACLFERNLGELNGKTLVAACDAVCDIFKDVYNEVDLYRCTIHQIVHSESDRFFSVLNDGLQYLKKQVKDGVISGKVAFTLHDTFGFPIELTRDIASDNQWELDEASFWTLMTRQKEQSKAAKTIFVGIRGSILRTEFTGYDSLSARAKVLQIQNIDNRIAMICDKTCFYAESGGQVADIGKVLFDGQSYQVVDVQKTAEGCFVHWLSVGEVNFGVDDFVLLEVDHQHRASVSRAHSATHLIHYALRKILGSETRQAGSRVTSDNLRFDFTYFGELPYSFVDDLEAIVNQLAFDSYSVEISYSTLEQALAKGALAFFGDKYDPSCVRLVKIGPSIELCGGTHVKYSCQILPVVINSVHSISSGVKRIEANVGLKAIQTSKRKMIEVQRALDLAKSKTNIVDTVQKLLTEVERGKQALSHLENKMSDIVFDSLSIHEFENCTLILLSSDLGFLAEKIFDRAMSRFRKVVVVAVPKSSATDLLVGSQIGFSADQTLKGLISRLGGKGGGNPRFARGFVSTKDEDRIKTALLEIFE